MLFVRQPDERHIRCKSLHQLSQLGKLMYAYSTCLALLGFTITLLTCPLPSVGTPSLGWGGDCASRVVCVRQGWCLSVVTTSCSACGLCMFSTQAAELALHAQQSQQQEPLCAVDVWGGATAQNMGPTGWSLQRHTSHAMHTCALISSSTLQWTRLLKQWPLDCHGLNNLLEIVRMLCSAVFDRPVKLKQLVWHTL